MYQINVSIIHNNYNIINIDWAKNNFLFRDKNNFKRSYSIIYLTLIIIYI
jgi:hypothetical protein